MAQRVSIVLVDDLDGSEATETVSFAVDDNAYEIDLNDAHAAALRELLSTYVENGRKTASDRGRRSRRSAGTGTRSSGSDSSRAGEIRDWARGHGIDVPDRGRVPQHVRDAYRGAH